MLKKSRYVGKRIDTYWFSHQEVRDMLLKKAGAKNGDKVTFTYSPRVNISSQETLVEMKVTYKLEDEEV